MKKVKKRKNMYNIKSKRGINLQEVERERRKKGIVCRGRERETERDRERFSVQGHVEGKRRKEIGGGGGSDEEKRE